MSQLGDASWNHFSEIKWLQSVLKDKDTPAGALAWLRKYNHTLYKRTFWGKINEQAVTEYVEKELKRLRKEVEDEH